MFQQLFSSLMGTGQQMAQAAPVSMADIKVPQMPLDPGSIAPAVGANVAADLPNTMAAQQSPEIPEGLLRALASGGVNAIGGGKKEQEQLIAAPAFRGSAMFDNPGAQAFSGKVVGAPNLRGILGG